MGIKNLFQWMPEFWVSVAFLQCGTWMVFMIYSFNMKPEFYSITSVGPQVLGCAGAVLTGVLLTLLRMWKGRVVFVHFFLILIGSGLFLLVATLSVVDSDKGEVYSSALSIGGFAHGIVYVAGMSYVHIRAGSFRVQRIAFLHVVYLFGIATTAHSVHEYNKDYAEPRDDRFWAHANHPIAYHFFGYSALAVIVLLLNFIFQGRLYNGKALLDPKMSVANGKLDHFKSALGMPIIQGIAEKPDTFNQLKVTKIMLTSKLTGGLAFNNLLIGLVFYAQRQLFTDNEELSFIVHYMTIIGLVFGFVASFFIQLKWIFIPGTFLHCIILIVALSLYTGGSYVAATVFMWLFYILVGIVYLVPDVGLMEVAPLQYYDSLLGIGYCFEAVPLMIASHMMNQYFPVEPKSLWIAGGIAIAGLLIACILMIFWYPDTLRRSILDIQYMLLYPGKSINIRPVAPVQESVTVGLDSPPVTRYPPTMEEKPAFVPIQAPVAPTVTHPEVQPVAPNVPYPDVTTPVQGITPAVTMDAVNEINKYPGPPAEVIAKPAIIETTEIYPAKAMQAVNNNNGN